MKKILLFFFIINTAVFSQESIKNNASFQKGLVSWQFGVASYDEDIPDAEFEVVKEGFEDQSACKIRVKISTESKNLNDVYLMHRGLQIKKGKKYRVSFYIKSTKKQDKVFVSVGSGTPPDLQLLVDREMLFTGDNSWKKISFAFLAKKNQFNVDFNDLSLFLGFNHRFGTFYVDKFSLAPL